jgi:hypothetical protein
MGTKKCPVFSDANISVENNEITIAHNIAGHHNLSQRILSGPRPANRERNDSVFGAVDHYSSR